MANEDDELPPERDHQSVTLVVIVKYIIDYIPFLSHGCSYNFVANLGIFVTIDIENYPSIESIDLKIYMG